MSKGKLILEGKIRLISPAIMGCGRDENTDMDIIRDIDGKPFIPATSFIGVLRHSIKPNGVNNDEIDKFWGSKNTDMQSQIFCRDLTILDSFEISIRDGVKINNKRGIAEQKGKFDYEIIERDALFSLYILIDIADKDDDINLKKKMLAAIIKAIEEENIRIGSKTNSGFGKIKLAEYNIYEFDFTKKDDILKWFKKELPKNINLDDEIPEILKKEFVIEADFKIKNSFIIRSYTYEANQADMIHISSKGKPILPGTSLKGAIRCQAERIINTIGKPISLITNLFGTVDKEIKQAIKGRIQVEDTLLPLYSQEIQTRIKIDRFTGGAIEGALFETQPLFSNKNDYIFKLKISINDFMDYEAGLMLLILKDLWTGNLAIGGEKAIGRGVLEGKSAIIKWNNESILIKKEGDKLEISPADGKNKLEYFVKELVNYGGSQ